MRALSRLTRLRKQTRSDRQSGVISRRRLTLFPCALIWFILAAGGGWGSAGEPENEWPRYAHDGALTSHSPLPGRISRPRAAWAYSVAGRAWLLQVSPAAGRHRLALKEEDTSLPAPQRPMAMPGPLLADLDGSGTLRAVRENYHERWARVLPEVTGWQRVAWNQTWTDQKVCRLELFAYDRGIDRPRRVWQTDPPEGTVFQPLNVVSDIDGDGVMEVCVAAHYRVMVFEGTTGRKESELRYHNSRPYGWFGLADVDADGQVELVTLGDFQSHVDVLRYDPGQAESNRLSVLWRRDIEQAIEERRKWPQFGPEPVVDVAGDRRLEIVFNLFNDRADGQWHAVVWNGVTGEVLHDFPRRFLQGTADLDQDGRVELFLVESDGVVVPESGRIELVGVRDGSPQVIWSKTNSAWAVADRPRLGSAWSTTAAQGMRRVLVTPGTDALRPVFLAVERSVEGGEPFPTSLSALRLDPGGDVTTLWQVRGLAGDLEPVAVELAGPGGAATALVRLRVGANTACALAAEGAEIGVVESNPTGAPLAPPIAARLERGGPVTVVVEGAARQIFALQAAPGEAEVPLLAWRRPGRGMSDGSRQLGLLAADLDGDAGNEVVVAHADRAGLAQLVAYRRDGTELWRQTMAETPGGPPAWNQGGLTFWWPGCFRTNGQVDLFVNTRRGLMHSDIGQLLDGRTGERVWRQEKAVWPGQFSWGYAGIPPAIMDLNRDGLDELICLYPVCLWVGEGATGRLLKGVELASRKSIPAWAAYGEPMVRSFTGGADLEILLDTPYILGLLSADGVPIWHGRGRIDYPTSPQEGNAGETTGVKHALVDFDGDGRPEIASAGYGDGVRAIDPRNGQVLWSLPVATPSCPRAVAANIDGEEGEELLFVAGQRLIAVTGDRVAGRVLWEWTGPAALAMPIVADVDGDGLAEIVVTSGDGVVHCLDSP